MVTPFDLLDPTLQKLIITLEIQDRKERQNKIERKLRLRQIPRETGEFLFQILLIHAKNFPSFLGVEIGTSGGYSAIWQGAALQILGYGQLISLDNDPRKHEMALETINRSPVKIFVKLIQVDAKKYLKSYSGEDIHYMFVDAEKEDYLSYLELFLRMNAFTHGPMLIADNVKSHENDLVEFLAEIKDSTKVSSIILPVGKGLALVQKL